MIIVPSLVSGVVIRLCRQVVARPSPVYVPIRPERYSQPNECFPNVNRKVDQDGGNIKYGWQVWERRRILIEAEFHAVWESPKGELIDITPKARPFDKILFCPDPSRIYTGTQVNNVRVALVDDPLIHGFIDLFDAYHEEMNRGQLAEMHGFVPISPKALKIKMLIEQYEHRIQTKYLGRNDPCPCGSGKKFKNCHGSSQ